MRRIVILAAGLLCNAGCNEKNADPNSSASVVPITNATVSPPGITESAPTRSTIISGNLDELYQRAVKDFAEYETTQRSPVSVPRSFRLGQLRDEISLDDDTGSHILHLDPVQFAGVDFKTVMGDRLLNTHQDKPTVRHDGIHTVGVLRIWHSKSKRRVQITLAWIDTICESWTFLYNINNDDTLKLSRSVFLACDIPEGWID